MKCIKLLSFQVEYKSLFTVSCNVPFIPADLNLTSEQSGLLSLLNSITVPQIYLTWLTNKLSTGVLDRAKCCQASRRTSDEGPLPDAQSFGKT